MNNFYRLVLMTGLFVAEISIFAADVDIFAAVSRQDLAAVNRYLDAGRNVNAQDDRPGDDGTVGTPLRYVLNNILTEHGNAATNEEIFRKLVEHGADTNITTENGVPLREALRLRNKLDLLSK